MNARQTRWLQLAELWGGRIENGLLFVLLSGLILLASSQIILRNIFSLGLAWGDGMIRLMVLWLALTGGIAASRDKKQIAIDVLIRVLPENARRAADVAAHLFTALVTGLMAWHSLRFVRDSYEFGDRLLSDWPAWMFQVILPFGFAAISYRYLLRATQRLLDSGNGEPRR